MSAHPFRIPALACWAVFCSACVSVREDASSTGDEMRGQATQAGTFAVSLLAGVATGYTVDSTLDVVDANFGGTTYLSGDLIGTYGLGLRAEYFMRDDWMLFIGGEQRVFQPDLGEDLVRFGEATQIETFLGTRYYLPWRALKNRRLRTFLQAKLAYIPRVEFDMTTRLPFDPPLEDGVLQSQFKGDEYWTMAAGAGLAYELTPAWMLSLGFFYEWPLGTSDGRADATLAQSTGNAFVDNILSALEYDVSLEPQGWIAFLNLSYAF